MSFTIPTVSDFKSFFARDFPFGETSDKVMESDIERATGDSYFNINHDLFIDQTTFSVAHNYLTAHNLVTNIKASSQGMGGSFSWLENSKGVGSVSQSYAIPSEVLENPAFAILAKTNYGAKYLSLILPLLHGNMQISEGSTQS